MQRAARLRGDADALGERGAALLVVHCLAARALERHHGAKHCLDVRHVLQHTAAPTCAGHADWLNVAARGACLCERYVRALVCVFV